MLSSECGQEHSLLSSHLDVGHDGGARTSFDCTFHYDVAKDEKDGHAHGPSCSDRQRNLGVAL